MAALSSSTPNRSTTHIAAAAFVAVAVVACGWSAVAGAQDPAGEQEPGAQPSHADVRAQTRIVRRGGTAVTEAQAAELTLTLTEAAVRPVQAWVRAAGSLDKTGHVLTTYVRSPEAEQIAVGQRVRSFSVVQRTQMYQAKITRVTPEAGGARIEATVAAKAPDIGAPYLMEIVVEQGPFLSVPNASIIEEGADKVVYVRQESGTYAPRTIHTGIEGELYTQVLDGLAEGDQIVSIGSFFVDADNKLKGGSE